MTKTSLQAIALLALTALCGCVGYNWSPAVPDRLRTVAVPTFVNHTQYAEFGPTVTQYTLREFQKEGTFSIRRQGDSAIELQGEVVDVSMKSDEFDRNIGYYSSGVRMTVSVKVTALDKRDGKVLYTRVYDGVNAFVTRSDVPTSMRNSAPIIAQEISRQIVDDLISYWDGSRARPWENLPAEDEKSTTQAKDDDIFSSLENPDEVK